MLNPKKYQMKKIILINLLLLFVYIVVAQNESPVVAVSATKMNVLYIGVENPIQIGISNLCGQQPEVSISQGSIKYLGNGEYIAYVKEMGETIISVTYSVNGEKVTVKKHFRTKRVPDPTAKVGGKNGGSVPKSWLMAQKGLMAILENFDYDLSYKIKSFTVLTKDDNYETENPSPSAAFTETQRKQMAKLKSGDTVYIQDIKAIGPDGIERQLGNCIFTIQ